MEENASLFTNNSTTPCDFNIKNQNPDSDNTNDTNISNAPKQFGIHSQSKHKYRNTFGNTDTVTKINHVLYQTIAYNENGMFTTKLMNDTPVEIFIDNGATPSILPLHTYNKFHILHTYPKKESNTPIHTGGGLIKSHFWLEIPLKLDHQTIQIKALVCDSECPYDIVLGWTFMAQLSAWQDYASHKLYIQQISVPLTVRNNVWALPGKTGVVSLTLQPNKTSFTPRHTITGKGIAYVKPFDTT